MKKITSLFFGLFIWATSIQAQAQTALYWDADGGASVGGTGTWDTAGTTWNTATTGAANTVWVGAANFADFRTTAGTVTVTGGGITTGMVTTSNNGALTFQLGGYSLTGGTITADNTGGASDENIISVLGGTSVSIANNIAITPHLLAAGTFNRFANIRVTNAAVTMNGNFGLSSSVTGGTHQIDFVTGASATGTNTIFNGIISNYLGAGSGGNIALRVGSNGTSMLNTILTLNGVNTFTGGVTIADGTVIAGNSNALGTGGVGFGTGGMAASTTATLLTSAASTISNNMTISSQTNLIAAVVGVNGAHNSTFSGSVTWSGVNSPNLTLSSASGGTATFSGLFNDGIETKGVIKSGAGVAVLSRAAGNTYDGGTTVNAGTLRVMNTSGSATGTGAVTINATGILAGTGIIAPTGTNGITVASGGAVNPGAAGIGTLIVNGGSTTGTVLTMQTGSTFNFEIGAGTSDRIDLWNFVSGDLALNSNTINIINSGATVGTYNLFRSFSDSGTTATAHGLLSGLTLNLTGGITGSLVYNTNTIDLNVTAVPEPSTYAMLFAGLGLLICVCRRQRRNA